MLASQELSDADDDKRPTVQIGDPFTGKKLIELSLALVESGLCVSLQDLGAAGLASSLAEMAARGGAGVDVHLDRVPQRETAMEPVEIMISESQERMVAVVEPERLAEVEALCARWELACTAIGEVTESGELRCFYAGEPVGEIPARFLTDEAPRYPLETEAREPAEPVEVAPAQAEPFQLLELLGAPNIRSRRRVFERYDQLVGSRTVRRPGLDAAVLRLRPSMRGLAVSLDGPGRAASLDPRTAGMSAVLESARNVACAGGTPLAITNCLNFGNPEKPEVAWELTEAIEGMALACEALGIPVVSGNVSLYNETDGRAIDPTPVVGCVGTVEDVRTIPSRWQEGDVVLLAGDAPVALDGSEFQARFLGGVRGCPPRPDLERETALISFLAGATPILTSAHDASDGGLAVALAELAIWSGLGAEIELDERHGHLVRRGRRPCGRHLPARGRRAARRRAAAADRRGRRRLDPRARGSTSSRRRTSTGRRPSRVRHPRHPRARPGRRAARLLRALRAPAPRPGVGRDRGLGQRPADGDARHGARVPGLLRGEPPGPARPGGDRALPLLHDRVGELDERAAGRAARPGAYASRSGTTGISSTRPLCATSSTRWA